MGPFGGLPAFKRALGRAAPGPHRTWQRYWQRRIDRHRRRIREALVARHGSRVMGGPFAGLYYPPGLIELNRTSRLIGAFESELHAVVERICMTPYDTIINVGCSEGYYAVGFALRMPAVQVHAYDIDPIARRLCAELARANGVGDRVHVGGEFDPRTLHGWATGRTLLWSDCEGCEMDVLQPGLAPEERTCDIVVELHDFLRPGVRKALVERFAESHHISFFPSTKRDPDAYPVIAFLPRRDRRRALSEFRPVRMEWAVMTAQESALLRTQA